MSLNCFIPTVSVENHQEKLSAGLRVLLWVAEVCNSPAVWEIGPQWL